MKYLTFDSDLSLERHWVSLRTIEAEAHISNIYTFEDIHRKVWLLNLSMQNVVEWRLFQLWSPSLDKVRVNCIYWTVYRWSRSYSSKLLQNHTKRLTITKIFGHPHRIDYEMWNLMYMTRTRTTRLRKSYTLPFSLVVLAIHLYIDSNIVMCNSYLRNLSNATGLVQGTGI